jgi:pimeloyl-ACP methyl ester carboxylesterase
MIREVHYPFPVKHITIHDGIDIAYCDEGNNERVILFIHGLANYLPAWKYQVRSLRDDFRCIALDLPGNGLSSRGQYPYSMFFYAECIVRFIEKLKLEQVVLCGHSMGGQIALTISLRYPHLLKKLVLIAPAGLEYFTPHEIMLMQQALSIGDFLYADEFHLESAIRQSFFTSHTESEGIISDLKSLMKRYTTRQWREMVTSSVRGMLNEQVSQFIQHIACPALVVFGEKDRLIPNPVFHAGQTPESIGKYGAAVMQDASLKMIPDAGHFVHLEKQEEVNRYIREFMNIGLL